MTPWGREIFDTAYPLIDRRKAKIAWFKKLRLRLRVVGKPHLIQSPSEWSFGASPSCSCCYAADTTTNPAFFVQFLGESGQGLHWLLNRWFMILLRESHMQILIIYQLLVRQKSIQYLRRSKVEAMLSREKKKASVSSICIDLKPLYAVEVASKPY